MDFISTRATTRLWTGGHLEFLYMRWLLVTLLSLLISLSRSMKRLCQARYAKLSIGKVQFLLFEFCKDKLNIGPQLFFIVVNCNLLLFIKYFVKLVYDILSFF